MTTTKRFPTRRLVFLWRRLRNPVIFLMRVIKARLNTMPKQVEELIDEQCRKLNKTGVPQGSALHLAQWMKGQLDKQVIESEPIDSDPEQQVEDWTIEKVTNRSKELNLVDSNGSLKGLPASSTKVHSTEQVPADEISMFEDDEDKSFSKSTTSDSQVSQQQMAPFQIVFLF